jgi:orotate phosphoribosyltransferase
MNDDILKLFEQAKAYLRGHFLLTSGRHSEVYFEKFMLLQYPDIMTELCTTLAAPYQDKQVQTVVGPTLGGVVIAYEVARQLGCRAIYAEADGDLRVLRRGFSLDKGERVLLVDDILTTGRSVREVVDMAESYESDILGIALMLDRSGGTTFKYPLTTLASIDAESYDPGECPLCLKGEPITQRGSRATVQ